MSRLNFSVILPALPENLMKLLTDYEYFPNYVPDQLKNVKIIEKNGNKIITEEIIQFKTIFKTSFVQQSIHEIISDNKLSTKIISGLAQNSTIITSVEKIDSGTKVSIDVDLKISLKAKILEPIIKKWYKRFLTAILYRMNTTALGEK